MRTRQAPQLFSTGFVGVVGVVGVAGIASALALLGLAAWPALAVASTSPVVYHSPADDGARPATPPTLPPGPNATLHLYMDETDHSSDASLSDVCAAGSGDERCGWELTIDADGFVDFVGFTPSGDVIAGLTTGAEPRLRMNGGNPVAGELGPVKLGDLEISSSGDGAVDLTAGAVVDSMQQKVVLGTEALVSVPEPSAPLMWTFGALALGLLQRRRGRRRA